MMKMDIVYYCILVLSIVRYNNGVQNPPVLGKCISFREYGMMAADCKWRNFVEVPQVLNKNIEIMVASGNRIRELTSNSFKEYTSIRFLYLDNNFIVTIEEDTFTPLTELEVLDLSSNAIKNIPDELPYTIRRLYLSENHLDFIHFSEAYNLQYLALSYCKLKELPNLGLLPNLLELNLTGNPLISLSPLQLSSMCRLKTIYLPMSLYKSDNSECDCYKLLTWTTEKNIKLGNYTCTTLENSDDCYTNTTEEDKTFQSCLLAEPKIVMSKYYVMAVILLLIVLVFCVMLCCCRRKKKRKSKPRSIPRTNSSSDQEKKITTLIL